MNVTTKLEASTKMIDAMKSKDAEAFAESMQAFGDALANELKAEMKSTIDSQVMASRGHALTTAEMKFADAVKAMAKAKLTGTKMALQDTDVVMPETIINKVFEDITIAHPLLNYIDFQNTSYSTKWLMSKNVLQKAQWGEVDAEAVKEVEASFLEMDMTLLSLIAYIPVSWALLDLGPSWIVTYVVTILKEALANGLEDGIINGAGNGKEPVGLVRNTEGKYNGNLAAQDFTELKKTAKKITTFDPKTCGEIMDVLTTTPNGNRRIVNKVIIAVNPGDYWTKVFPATTVQGTNGQYVKDVLPIPAEFVQSPFVNAGESVAMVEKGYWMGTGYAGTAGRLTFSDDAEFLKRKRLYMTEVYANGQPKDNNVSVLLDISKLKPLRVAVETSSEATE